MLIQAEALSKRYGALTALDGCSLSVERGEVFGLLGPNGAGKTTLLRILLGMLRPTSGTARIDALDCYRQAVAVHRRLSYLPGDARMGRNLTGRIVLEFFTRLHPAASRESALALAERLKLDLSRKVGQMSTGMRQKLALALALAPDVPLVVLDEPTSNLDPSVRSDVLDLLREARDAGRAVLFSSHVLAEAEEVCDRVAVLGEGKVAETVVLSQLKLQHRITAQLAGELVLPAGALAEQLHIEHNGQRIRIQTEQPLPPLLGWLAEQPLDELRIEPLGLRTVYEKHHPRAEP